MALAYLVGAATQGSADAFVQAEVATALTGQNQRAFRVGEILFELSTALAFNADLQAVLSRRSKAAMPALTDRDVIAKWDLTTKLTTSGAVVTSRNVRFTFTEDDELLIVEDPVYLIVDSTGTGLANTVNCRIGYTSVSISAVDRLTLLTQSLE